VGLKRRSAQNIVIGGAAGAIPPMVGWVAGAGQLDLAAVVLFAIVFVWTPPHFWALALMRKAEYARAGIPMLPVVRGDHVTRRHIFVYSLVLVGTTLVLAPVNAMGWIYAVAAVLLGLIFVQRAWRLMRAQTVPAAERLFRFSVTYLTVLFGVMVVDVLLGPAI
jgi:protoheme IX farnesyltransferase